MPVHTQDLVNGYLWLQGIPPQTITELATGTGLNLIDGDGRVTLFVAVGSVSGDTLVNISAESSFDGSTWSSIDDLEITDLGADTLWVQDLVRPAPWIRCLVDVSGTSPEATVSVLIGQPRKLY